MAIKQEDFLGAISSMMVVLPSSIAFGLLIFGPLGAELGPSGAVAGLVGSVTLPLVAGLLGRTGGLITAPCAPAAALLSAFTIAAAKSGAPDPVLQVFIIGMIAGIIQLIAGSSGLGKLIKFIPFPVVSGYLSGVGALIIIAQVQKLQNPIGAALGSFTIILMSLALWKIKKIPAIVVALVGGIFGYFAMSLVFPELQAMENNPLIVGHVPGASEGLFFSHWWNDTQIRFGQLTQLTWSTIIPLFATAGTLAVLLSIDTLKTCVIVDALKRTQHQPNRELTAQGISNLITAAFGGMAGAGTMGATLVNITAGAQTRYSSILTGVFSLIVLAFAGRYIGWIPIPVLSGILIVVGFRMIDRSSFRLLKQKTTAIDFVVILTVIISAVAWGLIAAAGMGLALSILLFLRENIRTSIVRRVRPGTAVRSKRKRLPEEMEALEQAAKHAVIFELQGSLFFGTTDQLLREVQPWLTKARFIVFDMRRIQTLDITAAQLLNSLESRVAEKNGLLIFTNIPHQLPSGKDIRRYFGDFGLREDTRALKVFDDFHEAIEWLEELLIKEVGTLAPKTEHPLNFREFDLFRGSTDEALFALQQITDSRTVISGEKIFKQGDVGDEIYLVREGEIRISLPLENQDHHLLAVFSKGDFFGDMSFLDDEHRSADAIASVNTELYSISRQKFEQIVRDHPALSSRFYSQLSRMLALRLRQTNIELSAIEDS